MLCSDTTWPLPLIYTFISYFTLCLAYGDTYYSGCHIWTISRVTDNSQCDTKADETVVRWGMNWGVSKHTVNRIRIRWSYRSYFNRTSEKVMWWVSKLISIRNQIFKCLNPKLTRCQRCDKLITFVFKPCLLCFFFIARGLRHQFLQSSMRVCAVISILWWASKSGFLVCSAIVLM